MSKKIHLTESQIEEIVDKLNEADNIELQTTNFPNQPLARVVGDVQQMQRAVPGRKIRLNGVDVNTAQPAQTIANSIQTTAKQVSDGVCESNVYTKKQIKEAKLRYLKEHSTAYSKKDFKNRFIKN